MLNFLSNKKKRGGLLKYAVKLPFILFSFAVILFSKTKRRLKANAKNPGIFTISFGNISMGGSGKTPFSFALAEYLHGLGLKPCIISRGYKGRLKKKFI